MQPRGQLAVGERRSPAYGSDSFEPDDSGTEPEPDGPLKIAVELGTRRAMSSRSSGSSIAPVLFYRARN